MSVESNHSTRYVYALYYLTYMFLHVRSPTQFHCYLLFTFGVAYRLALVRCEYHRENTVS